jgi:hypothetical protein
MDIVLSARVAQQTLLIVIGVLLIVPFAFSGPIAGPYVDRRNVIRNRDRPSHLILATDRG